MKIDKSTTRKVRPSFRQTKGRHRRPYDSQQLSANFVTLTKNLIVYKKTYTLNKYNERVGHVTKLLLPAGTQVRMESPSRDSALTGTITYNLCGEESLKCRAAKAVVQSHHCRDSGRVSRIKTTLAGHGLRTRSPFKYTVGETVRPRRGLSRIDETCEAGIHFFLHPAQAALYD